jgi:hypothetical protein
MISVWRLNKMFVCAAPAGRELLVKMAELVRRHPDRTSGKKGAAAGSSSAAAAASGSKQSGKKSGKKKK